MERRGGDGVSVNDLMVPAQSKVIPWSEMNLAYQLLNKEASFPPDIVRIASRKPLLDHVLVAQAILGSRVVAHGRKWVCPKHSCQTEPLRIAGIREDCNSSA